MTKQEFDSSLFLTLSLEKRTSSLEKKRKKIKEREREFANFILQKQVVYRVINIYRSISRLQEETINRREKKKKREKKLDELVKAISKARKEWFIDEGLAMYRVKSAPLICLSGCK